jgi:hypothetical protein
MAATVASISPDSEPVSGIVSGAARSRQVIMAATTSAALDGQRR